MRLILSALFSLVLAASVAAQGPGRGSDTTIDAATRALVIGGVLQRLDQGYIFPKKVAGMTRAVRERLRRGDFDRITSAQAFADTLTRDLQSVSRDKHLEVAYHSRGVVDELPDAEPTAEERRERAAFGRRVNFGFERVEDCGNGSEALRIHYRRDFDDRFTTIGIVNLDVMLPFRLRL